MIQRSKISRQLVVILVFRENVTILLPFGAQSAGQGRPAGEHAKERQRKDAQSAPLPVLGNFGPRNTRMIRNDENDEARMTNDEN